MDEGTPHFTVCKVSDDDKMLVFGYASVAVTQDGAEVIDYQNHIIDPDTLEKAAYEFVLSSREGDVMHDMRPIARLVESFVVTKAKLTALGLTEDALPQGWFVGFKVDDPEVWKRVKDGELKMFSIYGTAHMEDDE